MGKEQSNNSSFCDRDIFREIRRHHRKMHPFVKCDFPKQISTELNLICENFNFCRALLCMPQPADDSMLRPPCAAFSSPKCCVSRK